MARDAEPDRRRRRVGRLRQGAAPGARRSPLRSSRAALGAARSGPLGARAGELPCRDRCPSRAVQKRGFALQRDQALVVNLIATYQPLGDGWEPPRRGRRDKAWPASREAGGPSGRTVRRSGWAFRPRVQDPCAEDHQRSLQGLDVTAHAAQSAAARRPRQPSRKFGNFRKLVTIAGRDYRADLNMREIDRRHRDCRSSLLRTHVLRDSGARMKIDNRVGPASRFRELPLAPAPAVGATSSRSTASAASSVSIHRLPLPTAPIARLCE